MARDIFLWTRRRDGEQGPTPFVELSSKFCQFVAGPDTFGSSEFEQMENLLDIDLSILRKCPDNWTAPKVEGDASSAIEGWTSLEELEEFTLLLLDKLEGNPLYHLQLRCNLDWGDYFHPRPKHRKLLESDVEQKANPAVVLREDLKTVVDWISSAKESQVKFVTFRCDG
ncbi:MAG: hypothetical protein AAFV95_03380 [Bacteroidota bacterium]